MALIRISDLCCPLCYEQVFRLAQPGEDTSLVYCHECETLVAPHEQSLSSSREIRDHGRSFGEERSSI